MIELGREAPANRTCTADLAVCHSFVRRAGRVPDLFGWKNRKDKPGLVLKYDMVAFDEVAGSTFKNETTNRHTKTTWKWAHSREG